MMRRSRFLKGALSTIAVAGMMDTNVLGRPSTLPSPRAGAAVKLINSVTSLRSPFAIWWDQGGRECAQMLNASYKVCENEGTIDKVIEQFKKEADSCSDNLVFNIDLGTRYSAERIFAFCARRRIYFVTHGGELVDLTPPADSPYYVAHFIDDHFAAGRQTGRALIGQVGRSGSILALGGPSEDPAAKLRQSGFDRAAYEAGISIADVRFANWEPSLAYEYTQYWIQQYRTRLGGIWAANDTMAIGAIEALRAAGLAGKVPVTGIDGHPAALASIQDNELLATVPRNAFFEGGAGLLLAYGAAMKRFDPAQQRPERRSLRMNARLVNRDNIATYITYRSSLRGSFGLADLGNLLNGKESAW